MVLKCGDGGWWMVGVISENPMVMVMVDGYGDGES